MFFLKNLTLLTNFLSSYISGNFVLCIIIMNIGYMKLRLFLFRVLIIGIFFANHTYAQKTGTKPTESVSPKLKSFSDSIQYVLGAYVGQFLLSNGFTTIDAPYFQAGMQDVYNNRKRQIADSLQVPMMNAYRENVFKERGKILEARLFNSLKDKEGVGKLPSGVQYTIIKQGKGPRPAEMDSIIIHYKGMLADGTVFEDSYAKNLPILALPATLIPGMNECVQLMPSGSIWQLYIPSSQAYGEKGKGNAIPPNSALQITLELLQVRRK